MAVISGTINEAPPPIIPKRHLAALRQIHSKSFLDCAGYDLSWMKSGAEGFPVIVITAMPEYYEAESFEQRRSAQCAEKIAARFSIPAEEVRSFIDAAYDVKPDHVSYRFTKDQCAQWVALVKKAGWTVRKHWNGWGFCSLSISVTAVKPKRKTAR